MDQAVDVHHPRALELLRRDLHHLRAFFQRRGVPVHALAAFEALAVQPDAMPDGAPRSAPGSDGPGAVPCYRGSCGDETVVADALGHLEARLQEQAQRHASCACADGDIDQGGNKGAGVSGAAALP
jgi:serine/threonine-protein kinase RIO1